MPIRPAGAGRVGHLAVGVPVCVGRAGDLRTVPVGALGQRTYGTADGLVEGGEAGAECAGTVGLYPNAKVTWSYDNDKRADLDIYEQMRQVQKQFQGR